MAIENEAKFLVRPEYFGMMPTDMDRKYSEIEQHYLADGVRIRKLVSEGGAEYFFTFKRKTSVGLIEIEDIISEEDFVALQETAISSVKKTRCSFAIADEKWDVDLFQTDVGPFVIAEVEMQPGQTEPKVMLPGLEEFLVEKLENNEEFSNQEISCGKAAPKLVNMMHGMSG